MFNVRIKQFYDTEQIQIFSKGYRSEGDFERKNFNHFTGEIYPSLIGEIVDNPFTGERERLRSMTDVERSAMVSCSRAKKEVYDIARSNKWEWFFTFTFNPALVDSFDYNCCVDRLSKWLNNIRRICPDMVYIVVPEKHKSGRFHFHGLFSNIWELDFVDSGHKKSGKSVYNCGNYKYGFTTATIVSDSNKSASYLVKYITKDLCSVSKGRKRYWVSRNAKRPIVRDLMIESPEDDRLILYTENYTYIKKVDSPFGSCTYIDRPLL